MAGTQGDLGGATFRIEADAAPFEKGMARAQAAARRGAQVIDRDLSGMTSRARVRLDGLDLSLRKVGKRLEEPGKSGRFAMGLMAVGQAVDDMQYGFKSVVNNIPQLVYFLGGSAGIAGGAAIAAVAINQLIENWGRLGDALQSAWLNVPADHLEKLRIRTEKAAEAFDKLMAAPTKLQRAQIDAVADAMVEADKGGAPMVFKGLAEAVGLDPGRRAQMTDAQKERIEQAGKNHPQPVGPGVIPQPGLTAAQLRARQDMVRKQVEDELNAANRETARQIMGEALLPGEEGESGRAKLRGLMEQFPGNFREKFRKAMGATTDEAIEHRDANRAAAEKLMRSPIGTRMLLEGDRAPQGPATGAQIRGLLGKGGGHGPLGPRIREFLAKDIERQKMTPDQAREALGALTGKAMGDRARQLYGEARKGAPGPAFTPRGMPTDVAAWGQAMTQAQKELFAKASGDVMGRKGNPDATDRAIDAQLKAAGIEGDAPGVRREMRKMMDDRTKAIMLERGVTKDQARLLMLQEQGQKAFPGFGKPASFSGLLEKSKQLTTNALSGQGDVARRSLDELTAIRKAIDEGNKKKQQAAAVPVGPE